jgi:hypothetical protein
MIDSIFNGKNYFARLSVGYMVNVIFVLERENYPLNFGFTAVKIRNRIAFKIDCLFERLRIDDNLLLVVRS